MLKLLFIFSILTSCNNTDIRNTNFDSTLYKKAMIEENKLEDSLKPFSKYSYLIIGKEKGKKIAVGTAFFIKHGEDLFLTTAYHVFCSMDMVAGKLNPRISDALSLRLFNTETKKYEFWDIDISDAIKDVKPVINNDFPDVYCYKLKKEFREEFEINTIESFIDESNFDANTQVFTFGFPFETVSPLTEEIVLPTLFIGKTIVERTRIITDDLRRRVLYYYLVDRSTPWGVSGSPWFIINPSTNKISFLGISAVRTDTYTMVTKDTEVIKVYKSQQ